MSRYNIRETEEKWRKAWSERKCFNVTEDPEERPYGIDSGFRDPSGNSFRLTQVRDLSGV